MKSRNKIYITSAILLLLGNLLFLLTVWLLNKYDAINLDQILYQLKTSAAGANKNLLGSAYVRVGGFGILLTVAEILIYRLLSGLTKKFYKNEKYKKYTASACCSWFKKTALPVALAMVIFAVSFFVLKLNIVPYLSTTTTESDFIKENYIAPNEDKITFPEKKRNLIYIFLESMENTYMDTENGGVNSNNYIAELTALARDNVSFSNTEKLGGAYSFTGATWTAAAMVSQTSGINVKVPLNAENYGGENSFIPGIVSLGEVLEKQGYNQTLLIGSDSEFAGRDSYFSQHGNYNIVDIKKLKEEGRLPEDYVVWWGYEDKKLFDYAKEELGKLAESNEPFNFTMLTADTHFPNGYYCEDCEEIYDTQYANVLACSSRKVAEFIEWLKEQPYYDNTTIILSGDHLTMDPKFLADIDPTYTRTIYNCFINSAVNPIKEQNRQFGVFDMFPTTLSAMGVRIKGDRLGIGTDLFSASKTLTEIYGYETLNTELQKKSEFYNKNFLQMDNKKEKASGG